MHSFPFGFHRTEKYQRIGTENDVDKSYMGLGLQFVTTWLGKAVGGFEDAFADLVTLDRSPSTSTY
jgi:hypothetical protein